MSNLSIPYVGHVTLNSLSLLTLLTGHLKPSSSQTDSVAEDETRNVTEAVATASSCPH